MSIKVVHNLRDRVADTTHAFLVEAIALDIRLSELQSFKENLVVVRYERLLTQEKPGLLGGFDWIARQHTLVNQFGRSKRRLVAEHDFQEFQAVNVTAQHDQTNRQRSGQDQADRTP